jgi:hypothetical protein
MKLAPSGERDLVRVGVDASDAIGQVRDVPTVKRLR